MMRKAGLGNNGQNSRTNTNDRHVGGSQSSGGAVSGTQTKRVIDDMDGALKEAIRRSLQDKWNVKKESSKGEEATSSARNENGKSEKKEKVEEETAKPVPVPAPVPVAKAASAEEPEEEDIPVAPIVEISAGNDHTSRVLGAMDPKAKEAISRSLNDFFVQRANRTETHSAKDDHQDSSSKLSPDEETQKKIDAMDSAMKEAIRRSLTNFFANRRAMKEGGNEAVATPVQTSKEETRSDDDIERTREILDKMDQETKERIRRSLNDFFARRMEQNNSQTEAEEEQSAVQAVVLDVVLDDDDTDLSIGTESVSSKINIVDTQDIASKLSEETNQSEDWQMVTEDDEMLAVAAQMLGSALFQSDASLAHDSKHSS